MGIEILLGDRSAPTGEVQQAIAPPAPLEPVMDTTAREAEIQERVANDPAYAEWFGKVLRGEEAGPEPSGGMNQFGDWADSVEGTVNNTAEALAPLNPDNKAPAPSGGGGGGGDALGGYGETLGGDMSDWRQPGVGERAIQNYRDRGFYNPDGIDQNKTLTQLGGAADSRNAHWRQKSNENRWNLGQQQAGSEFNQQFQPWMQDQAQGGGASGQMFDGFDPASLAPQGGSAQDYWKNNRQMLAKNARTGGDAGDAYKGFKQDKLDIDPNSGMAQDYANRNTNYLSQQGRTGGRAGSFYDQHMQNRPDINEDAGLDPYYDNQRRKAEENINQQMAARGAFSSSAANDSVNEAFTNLGAEQANREADHYLKVLGEKRSWEGLGGQLAGQADDSGRASMGLGGQLAQAGSTENLGLTDRHRLQEQLGGGMAAASDNTRMGFGTLGATSAQAAGAEQGDRIGQRLTAEGQKAALAGQTDDASARFAGLASDSAFKAGQEDINRWVARDESVGQQAARDAKAIDDKKHITQQTFNNERTVLDSGVNAFTEQQQLGQGREQSLFEAISSVSGKAGDAVAKSYADLSDDEQKTMSAYASLILGHGFQLESLSSEKQDAFVSAIGELGPLLDEIKGGDTKTADTESAPTQFDNTSRG